MNILLAGLFALVTVFSGRLAAAEEVEIPFSLGKGQLLYEKYCSSCHGMRLDGSKQGPPLIHPYYKPSHHGDESFYRAALEGVRQHHWNFGDMPAIQGMTPGKMDSLLPYLRYYQQQKGLY
ncbi:MAG: c-type cytochrome [Gammaproteobacteria bacterium]